MATTPAETRTRTAATTFTRLQRKPRAPSAVATRVCALRRSVACGALSHFPDKRALLGAVAERGFDALDAAMTTRMDKVSGSAAPGVTCHCDVSHKGKVWRHALRVQAVAGQSADDQKGGRKRDVGRDTHHQRSTCHSATATR
jgi:hypothetical protein